MKIKELILFWDIKLVYKREICNLYSIKIRPPFRRNPLGTVSLLLFRIFRSKFFLSISYKSMTINVF